MKKINLLRIILILVIIAWMALVFGFSNNDAKTSSGISKHIATIFFEGKDYIDFAENVIRKIAHLSEYALGGFLIYALLLTFNINNKLQFWGAWGITTVYAITDEIHQLFVPGRTGRVVDVLIDSQGALLGTCVLLFIIKLVQMLKKVDKNK